MKFLLSFAVVTISIILLAPPLINGAPVQDPSQSPQTSEQVNKTLKEGLKVMLTIMRTFNSTRPKVRRNVANNGVCHVVDYISKIIKNGGGSGNSTNEGGAQNETTFFSRNDTLAAAERIQTDTCNWVNAIRKDTLPICSIEELQLLCLHIKIFDATVRANAATATVVDDLDEGQWINTHFPEDSPVRQQLYRVFNIQ